MSCEIYGCPDVCGFIAVLCQFDCGLITRKDIPLNGLLVARTKPVSVDGSSRVWRFILAIDSVLEWEGIRASGMYREPDGSYVYRQGYEEV